MKFKRRGHYADAQQYVCLTKRGAPRQRRGCCLRGHGRAATFAETGVSETELSRSIYDTTTQASVGERAAARGR